jgi:pyrroline-5-carboxylate reductase
MEVAIIGPGTMGLMIGKRLVDSGQCDAGDIRLSRVRPGRRDVVEKVLPGGRILVDNHEAVEGADLVVLAVKPRSFPSVSVQLRNQLAQDVLVISVVTGLDLKSMQDELAVPNVVRTSTNIGIESGAATTYWIAGPDTSEQARSRAAGIVRTWGDDIECFDESLLDIAMVGVGSGPALVIEFIQAMTRAMVTQGMPHDLAERGILSLLRGTLALRSAAEDRALSQFQQEVLTPGGITAEALLAMEEGKFRATLINAFRKAHEKVALLKEAGRK